jgi:hypothetical protein
MRVEDPDTSGVVVSEGEAVRPLPIPIGFRMSPMKDILSKVKEAMKESCTDTFLFSDDETRLIDAEYLLIVNAAKAIQSLNTYFGSPYRIYLEHNTHAFCKACTPSYTIRKNPKSKWNVGKIVTRGSVSDVGKSGRIDIAVYSENQSDEYPVCAIEVKGFNPAKSVILPDLQRNLEYFTKASRTGASRVRFTVFAALHSYRNTFSDEKEQKNKSKLKRRYDNYLKELNIPKSIAAAVLVFTLNRGLVPDPGDPIVQDDGLQGTEDYHFLGALVVFKNRSNKA